MKNYSLIKTVSAVVLLCGTVFLAGCQTDTSSQPSSSSVAPESAPNVGFSADVTQVAIDACRAALAQEAPNTAIEVTGSEFSQANSVVYMALGPQRAPWRCLVSNGGQVSEIMFMGSEGAL